MQELSLIQGFKDDLDLHLLSSLLNFDPAAHWGSTFALCAQRQNQRDKPKLMFMFGTMAFGGQADMTLIRSLIAICVMDESTELKLPQCAEFVRFRRDQIPTIETLAQYIRPHKIPYPDDERTLIGVTMHSKQRRKLEMAQIKYEEVRHLSQPGAAQARRHYHGFRRVGSGAIEYLFLPTTIKT